MKTTYFTYDKLKFAYSENELARVIDKIITDNDEKTFSFKSLCDSIMNVAQDSGKIEKKSNTVYLSNELDEKEYDRISILLWRKIWNQELCLNFHIDMAKGKDFKFIKVE